MGDSPGVMDTGAPQAERQMAEREGSQDDGSPARRSLNLACTGSVLRGLGNAPLLPGERGARTRGEASHWTSRVLRFSFLTFLPFPSESLVLFKAHFKKKQTSSAMLSICNLKGF